CPLAPRLARTFISGSAHHPPRVPASPCAAGRQDIAPADEPLGTSVVGSPPWWPVTVRDRTATARWSAPRDRPDPASGVSVAALHLQAVPSRPVAGRRSCS